MRSLAYGADVDEQESRIQAATAIQVQLVDLHGAAFNDELRTPEKPRLSFEPEMVRIEPGKFLMGSNDGDPDEKPMHDVTIAQSFAMSRYEITVGQFRPFVEDKDYHKGKAYLTTAEQTGKSCWNWQKIEYRSENNWKNPGFSQSDDHPVVCVSWDDAQAYVQWLSEKTGKKYRLPTEAEWEYAARANTPTRYWWGDDVGKDNANCDGCGSQWDNKQTAPVGSFKPNTFGLNDTAGNVWEWTQDCWHDDYRNAPTDGSSWLERDGGNCDRRVVRGGSWGDNPQILRSADRIWLGTGAAYFDVGFRIARAF